MRILILSWRDIKNPASGGAEVLTHEIAKRWVKNGNQVTLFSSSFKGATGEEFIDNVRIIRKGEADARYLFKSVHFFAFLEYWKAFKGKIDVVVDEIHGLPFFTPLYITEKKIALICEVADELWIKVYGIFFGSLGRLAEILYLRFIYKNIPYLTISQSTKVELIKNGVDKKNIVVLPMGINTDVKVKKWSKEAITTIIFVGRLSKVKGVEEALAVLQNLRKDNIKAQLWIVGRGESEYVDYLKRKAKSLKIYRYVNFFGYVDEKKKFELMSKAHILIITSIKEGFGLTIPEAGLMGTPSVVYNVAGVRDLITPGKNGIITKANSQEMAYKIKDLLINKKKYNEFAQNARVYAKTLNFDHTAKVAFDSLLNK